MTDTQVVVGMNVDGVVTGTEKAKRKISELGTTARNAGKGTGTMGDGAAQSATKVEAATKNMVGSIQRQIATLEAGDKSGRKYYETMAKMRGLDMATLGPYLAQLDAAKAKAAGATIVNNGYATSLGAVKLAALGAAGAVAVVVTSAKNVIGGVDAMNDLRDATGASIENISALEDVAGRTGTSWDTLSAGLIKFNGILKDAKPGSDAAKSIELLGLNVEELKRQDPAEALRQTAVAISGFADDANRARIVQDLFGKSTRDVSAFLKDLSEQGKLVATVTTQQADEAEKFNKQLFVMQKNVLDAARNLAGPLVTGLNSVIDRLKEVAEYSENPMDFAFNLGARAAGGTGPVQPEGTWTVNSRGAAGSWGENKPSVPDPTGGAEIERYITNLQKQIEKTKELNAVQQLGYDINEGRLGKMTAEQQNNLVGLAIKLDASNPEKKKTTGKTTDPYAATKRYIENLNQQIEKTQELTSVQQLGFDIAAGRLGKMTATQQTELVGLAVKLDATKAQTEAEKALTKALAERTKAEQDSLAQIDAEYTSLIDRLTSNTPTKQFESQQADLAALQTAFADGTISVQLYGEAVTELFDLNNDKLKQTKSLAEDLGLTFSSAAEDAIVKWRVLATYLMALNKTSCASSPASWSPSRWATTQPGCWVVVGVTATCSVVSWAPSAKAPTTGWQT